MTRDQQRGVAAVEFALIASLMIALLLGLFVFWRAFQVQQSLNRAAGDGARGVLSLITNGSVQPCAAGPNAQLHRTSAENTARMFIEQNLAQSGLIAEKFTLSSPEWKCIDSPSSESSFSFDVTYDLPPLLGNSTAWINEPSDLRISDRIVVHFTTGT